MTIEEFINELKKLGINTTEENLQSLEIYKDMLLEYNEKFNLTAIKTNEEINLKHFYDSLTLTKAIDLKENLKVLDIGTGAGFPGLVLKIFFPNLEMTLLDSNHKKIEFLNEVIKKLNLKNITCIYARAEELPEKYREHFDIITSRAVAELRILTELSLPFLKIGGFFIPMKSNVDEELENASSTLKVLKGRIVKKIKFNLPFENSIRTILKIEKLEATPLIYPRNYATIKKKILK